MQTQLAGPDGKTPAIDARTGQPLTMEEMLRRNGIVSVGNNVAMLGPQEQAGAPVASPAPAVASAMQARAGVNPAVAAGTLPKGGDPTSTAPDAAPPLAPAQVAQMEQLEASGADEGSISALEGLGLVAAGTAAMYGAYRAWKGMRNGQPNVGTGADLGGTGSYSNPQMIDAEFREIENALPAPATRRAVQGRSQAALPAPQKRIANNSRSAVAKVKAEQAARGSVGNDVINAQQAVRKVKEPLDAGVLRTLGGGSETAEAMKMLKKNPGLLRLLSSGL